MKEIKNSKFEYRSTFFKTESIEESAKEMKNLLIILGKD